MKEFTIHGKLIVDDCKNHQDMIIHLFEILRQNNIRFIGETKEVKDK